MDTPLSLKQIKNGIKSEDKKIGNIPDKLDK
jgi:hypothetical protein